MSFLETITSGNIGPNKIYYVESTPGTFITYNSVAVSVGEYFIGVDSVTTYTKDTGTENVVEASLFNGIQIDYVNTFFIGLFPDNSIFNGIQIESEVIPYFTSSDTVVNKPNNASGYGFNDWGISIKMNPLNILDLLRINGQDNTSILDYAGVIALIAVNSKVTGTVDGDGILTELKSESA
jgi:hypothetical protein